MLCSAACRFFGTELVTSRICVISSAGMAAAVAAFSAADSMAFISVTVDDLASSNSAAKAAVPACWRRHHSMGFEKGLDTRRENCPLSSVLTSTFWPATQATRDCEYAGCPFVLVLNVRRALFPAGMTRFCADRTSMAAFSRASVKKNLRSLTWYMSPRSAIALMPKIIGEVRPCVTMKGPVYCRPAMVTVK